MAPLAGCVQTSGIRRWLVCSDAPIARWMEAFWKRPLTRAVFARDDLHIAGWGEDGDLAATRKHAETVDEIARSIEAACGLVKGA